MLSSGVVKPLTFSAVNAAFLTFTIEGMFLENALRTVSLIQG